MTRRIRRSAAWVCAIALLFTACSGGGSDSDGGGTASVPRPSDGASQSPDDDEKATGTADSPATTLPRGTTTEFAVDPNTGELIEVEVEAPGPATFTEVVDAGIEAGLWDEVQGLTRVLGYAVGAISPERVPGADEVLTGELNDLLRRADALVLGGDHTDDELADLRRWYHLAVPSDDVISMLVNSATNPEASAGDQHGGDVPVASDHTSLLLASSAGSQQGLRALLVRQVQGCVAVDPDDFSGWAVIEGCYEMFEDVVEGVTLRVLYPAWYRDDPTLATYPLLAREALAKSVSTYSSLGELGDMTVVFSPVDTTESHGRGAVAGVDSQWQTATIATGCPITVFPGALKTDGPFQQIIAHEAWHCVQHYSGFPQGVVFGTAWYHEGGAEYFSNVVYPDVNREHGWLWDFDWDSRTKPLFSMSYETWIWWQFLANRESPKAVADLHLQMVQAGDGGKSAMIGYGPIFQRFVVEFVAGTIRDADGTKIPGAQNLNQPVPWVTKDDVGKVYEFEVQPFVAARFALKYSKELRVFESDQTSTDGEVAMAEWDSRVDPDNWRHVYPEVRSDCDNWTAYVFAVTTQQGTHKAEVKIDGIEEASCDPCVLGTWDLDLGTFEAMLTSAMAADGEAMPPGTSFEFGGHYYTSFDDQGVMREQRDGLVITIGSAEGSFGLTIDSFAEGRYTADGERLLTSDVVEFYSTVTTGIPGFGGASFAEGSSLIAGGAGDYECRRDDMTLTIDGYESVRLLRVDKILAPPTTLAP